MYKKEKNNYRPVSVLSNMSKLYERCMHHQINHYFLSLLSELQCGLRQGFSAQHCFLVMVEKMKKKKKNRDNRVVFGAVLTFRSEAFECIPHGLLIAKLSAFGFDKNHSPLLLPFSITETKN